MTIDLNGVNGSYIIRLESINRLALLLIIALKCLVYGCQYRTVTKEMSRGTTFPTRLHVHPAKTQISLRIRTDWSERCPPKDASDNWPDTECPEETAQTAQADLSLRAHIQSYRKYCTPTHCVITAHFNWAIMCKIVPSDMRDKKDSDQPAHPNSVIKVFQFELTVDNWPSNKLHVVSG